MNTLTASPLEDFQASVPVATRGAVRYTLQAEGLAALAVSAILYARLGESWLLFAALFLTPDLSMLGYLAGRRAGAFTYNLGHSYLTPAVLAALAWVSGRSDLAPLCLIWSAHIGFDRMLGYGLKYGSAFGHTHLGWADGSRR